MGSQEQRTALSLSSRLQGYLPAFCALVVAAVAHYLCHITIGITPAGIFFVYLMAVLISAWCGYGPGLLVLFLALVVLPFGYRQDFSVKRIDPIGATVLVMISLITSRLSVSRRRSEVFLQQANVELDQRVRRQTA